MRSLGTRLAVVISSIILVLVILFAVWLNKVLTEAIEQQGIEQVEMHAQTLLGTLKTLMLNGNGTLAQKWLEHLHGVAGIEDIAIIRRDGTLAFSDLKTIDAVNLYLGLPRFQRPPLVVHREHLPVEKSVFDEALQGNSAYDLTILGTVTVVQPIHADTECLVCHGYDNSMLRGVLKLSVSSQATTQRINRMQSMVWSIGVLLVATLAFALWFFIRLSFVKPIATLRSAIMSAGEGDRSAQIVVKRQDELGELASVFNQMQKDLAEGEARVRAVMDNVADGIITITDRGIIDAINPAVEHIFAYKAMELVGQHVNILIPDENRKNRDAFLLEELDEGSDKVVVGVVREISGKKKNGTIFPIDLAISDMRLGERYFYIAIVRDITNRKARIAELHYQAMHDALTDLPNRTLLLDRLQQAIRVAERGEHKLSLILMDLDRFKVVNDTLGHHVGDKLLQQIALRLKSVLRESDTVARLGGDEFCLLLPASHVKQAMFIARKAINVVEKTVYIDGLNLSVGASLGIASYPEHGLTPGTLLQRADVAMYEAKRNKLGFSVYDSKTDMHSLRQLAIGAELKDAIKSHQLVLHYQPKIDLKTNLLCGIEALVRWQHPSHGLLFPDEFVHLSEQSGLIKPLTIWVLNQALEECSYYMKREHNIRVSINLSINNLTDRHFSDEIIQLLNQHKVSASRLKLEVTEAALMENPKAVVKALSRLNALGLCISIDDFGSGYSSLAYLQQLPVNELKIDKSFNRMLISDSNAQVIVRSTIDMAHKLGLRVVAEGVESQKVLSLLKELGCDAAQGFYLGKPMPIKALQAWIEKNKRAKAGAPMD